ncbi:unnamed protein product, partial [Ascophyllum nodosum]
LEHTELLPNCDGFLEEVGLGRQLWSHAPCLAHPMQQQTEAPNSPCERGSWFFFYCHAANYPGWQLLRTGKIRGAFSRMHRALDGWMLARAPA